MATILVKRICGWCGVEMGTVEMPATDTRLDQFATHSICPGCAEKLDRSIEEYAA